MGTNRAAVLWSFDNHGRELSFVNMRGQYGATMSNFAIDARLQTKDHFPERTN